MPCACWPSREPFFARSGYQCRWTEICYRRKVRRAISDAPVASNQALLSARPTSTTRELAAESAPGEKLLCETRLARAGAALGFESAPMPAWVPLPRASVAIALALGPLIVPDPSALHLLCHGTLEFLRAQPWRYWTDNDPMEVVLDGAVQARYEGSLMGAAGIAFGVALSGWGDRTNCTCSRRWMHDHA